MPLGTSLVSDIQAVLDSAPASAHLAAVGFAQAYYDYVSPAVFGPDVPVLLTTARDLMAATLEASLDPITGLPLTAATAWSNAVQAFWLSPVVVCVGPAPGNVSAIPGASSIIGAMSATFSNLANTTATAASGMASALISATLTTTALLNLPPPTTFPIS